MSSAGMPGTAPRGGHTSGRLRLSACPLEGLLRPARHDKEGLRRGAAHMTDSIKVLGRERPAVVGKGKKASRGSSFCLWVRLTWFPPHLARGVCLPVCRCGCGLPSLPVLQSWGLGPFSDPFPPPRLRACHYCPHVTCCGGAASWERDQMPRSVTAQAVPRPAWDQERRCGCAKTKLREGRMGGMKRWEERRFMSSCLETGGQMWSELQGTD